MEIRLNHLSIPVFFNLGSAEPKGSAKIVPGSAKYLFTSSFGVYVYKRAKVFTLQEAI